MKQRIRILLVACCVLGASSMLTGCRKQCACIHNNGTIIYFSKTEVEDSNGGSCSGMKYQSGTEYFVACDWE